MTWFMSFFKSVSPSWWLWGSIPLAVVGYVTVRVVVLSVRYLSGYRHYYKMFRHPYFAPGLMMDVSDEKIFAPMRNPDGTYRKIVNWGPNFDGSIYIFISDRTAIQKVLSSKDDIFPKSPSLYDLIKVVFGDGLITSSGNIWRSERKVITPFFHFTSLAHVFPQMVALTKQFISEIENHSGTWLAAKDTLVKHSARVIITFAFGSEFDVKWINLKFKELTDQFLMWTFGVLLFGQFVWNLVPHKYGSGLASTRNTIRSAIYKVIKQRRESKEVKPDLLGHLCNAQNEDGSPLSEQLIADECLTFLFAGQDTTASTLCWIFYYLSKHPHVVEKIREELETMVGDSELTMEQVNNLSYCQDVVKETLRIQPVVPWLERIASEDCELAGTKIYKGTTIVLGIYPLHHDPLVWKNPEEFNPERWKDEESKKSFIWIPFSAGQRNCIGMKFAMLEIVVCLAMVVQKFDISINPEKKVTTRWEGVISPQQLDLKFTPISVVQ